MTDLPVLVDRKNGVMVLRLNEAGRRNALSAGIKTELEKLVPAFFADASARCLVITGSEGAFCAGGDISSLTKPQPPSAVRARLAKSYGWIQQLLDGEKPVITAINGPAVGAGFGLAMLGDIVLASDKAWFMTGFSVIGAAADYGLGRTLPRAIGVPRAKDILLSGRRVDAAEALSIGLVSRMIPDDQLSAEAMVLAEALATGPTVGLGLTKRLVNHAIDGSTSAYLEQEGLAQAVAFSTADHAEGVTAFLEKRKPVFRGQ